MEPSTTVVDISKLDLEGLAMLYIFMPPYKNHPEGELGNIARQELSRRGVLEILSETEDVWQLDEETKAEMFDIWTAHDLMHTFLDVVRPDSATELHKHLMQNG